MRGGVWIMKYLFFIKIQCVSLYMVYEIVYLNFQVIFLTENTIFDRSSGQNCSQPIRLDSSIGSFGSLLTPSSFFFFLLFFSPNFWVFTTVFLYFFIVWRVYSNFHLWLYIFSNIFSNRLSIIFFLSHLNIISSLFLYSFFNLPLLFLNLSIFFIYSFPTIIFFKFSIAIFFLSPKVNILVTF